MLNTNDPRQRRQDASKIDSDIRRGDLVLNSGFSRKKIEQGLVHSRRHTSTRIRVVFGRRNEISGGGNTIKIQTTYEERNTLIKTLVKENFLSYPRHFLVLQSVADGVAFREWQDVGLTSGEGRT